MHEDRQHPFHLTPVQELIVGDMASREQFCRYLMNHHEDVPFFLRSILWTDEAQFTRDGVTNFHNLHQWAHNNPHVPRENSFQRRFSVNVWAGIVGSTFIGPYFLPDTLNGERYLQFLEELLPELLMEVPLAIRNQLIFQQDGAPAHYTRNVREWLNEHFRNRWIGRGTIADQPFMATAWPPRSPDLTPMDFYAWGFMKSYVYESKINTREELVQKIHEAGHAIRANLREIDICAAVTRRANLCILKNGGHIENYL